MSVEFVVAEHSGAKVSHLFHILINVKVLVVFLHPGSARKSKHNDIRE